MCVLCSCCLFVIAMRNIASWQSCVVRLSHLARRTHSTTHGSTFALSVFATADACLDRKCANRKGRRLNAKNREVSARGIRETGTSRATLSAFCLHLSATHKSRIGIFAVQNGNYLVRTKILGKFCNILSILTQRHKYCYQ